MPYTIAGQTYPTKQAVTQRCRDILNGTRCNQIVEDQADEEFLLDLFSYHTEWPTKQGLGVAGITVQDTGHGTHCFWLNRTDGQLIDISFAHAVKHLPSAKTATLIPQGLIDFKNGARQAIKDQIVAFRQANPGITIGAIHVDHVYPRTFDALLFGFCLEYFVNPLTVEVVEQDGCQHYITDTTIRQTWQAYHQRYAKLQVVPKQVNLSAQKSRIDWSRTWYVAEDRPTSINQVDAYTRSCPLCGHIYQSDDHDDPESCGLWHQWEGPCCYVPNHADVARIIETEQTPFSVELRTHPTQKQLAPWETPVEISAA